MYVCLSGRYTCRSYLLEIPQIPYAKGMKCRNILVLLRSFSCAVLLFIAQLLFSGFVDPKKMRLLSRKEGSRGS